MERFCLGVIVAVGLTLPAFGQAVDPLIGTWKMNVEKSTSSAPLAKSQTLTWSGEGQNLIDTNEGLDAQGQPFKIIFRHIYDGMPHPTTGSPDYDSTIYWRIGNTINIVRSSSPPGLARPAAHESLFYISVPRWILFSHFLLRQGKTAELGQAVIVPGKTYTITVEGINANNQRYHSVVVFERQ